MATRTPSVILSPADKKAAVKDAKAAFKLANDALKAHTKAHTKATDAAAKAAAKAANDAAKTAVKETKVLEKAVADAQKTLDKLAA